MSEAVTHSVLFDLESTRPVEGGHVGGGHGGPEGAEGKRRICLLPLAGGRRSKVCVRDGVQLYRVHSQSKLALLLLLTMGVDAIRTRFTGRARL